MLNRQCERVPRHCRQDQRHLDLALIRDPLKVVPASSVVVDRGVRSDERQESNHCSPRLQSHTPNYVFFFFVYNVHRYVLMRRGVDCIASGFIEAVRLGFILWTQYRHIVSLRTTETVTWVDKLTCAFRSPQYPPSSLSSFVQATYSTLVIFPSKFIVCHDLTAHAH